ncbi:hypothetical protein Mapa_000202 [Marchantia paleacea]|nr:hypothetical protein Mapa_000202 [Marchantia paleacea]
MAEEENYANPLTAFFSVLFKAAALVFYIVFASFIDNFVIVFVITVFLVALDFWTVKNVSGRILVGLRWWNEINEDGESVWRFESLDQQELDRLNKKDSWLFWWTLYLTPVVWFALGIVAIVRVKLDYLLVVGVALVLSAANIIGFTKCRKDAKKQIQQFATQTVASQFASTLQTAFSV